MARYATHRLLLVVPTLLGMSILIFLMVRLLPGDVVDALLGNEQGGSAAGAANLRDSLGLNHPLPVQYIDFISGLLTGNLGRSFTTGKPVSDILVGAIPITLELTLLATALGTVVAVPLGVLSAIRPNTATDVVARLIGLVGLSLPNFWFATMALLFTSVVLHWVPPLTWIPPWSDPLGNLQQMAIPAIAIGISLMATTMRMTRSAMLEVLRQDFIRTAEAKGVRWRSVVVQHAFRNALIPVVTVVGLQIGSLMGGATLIEVIFGLPGIGYTLVQAIFARDYPVIQVTTIFIAAVFVGLNLFVDLLYGVLDPRVQQQ